MRWRSGYQNRTRNHLKLIVHDQVQQQPSTANLKVAKSLIPSVSSVMMVTVKTQTRLCSAMAAILQFTKNAMVCRLFQKVNGFAASACFVAVEFP